MKPHKQRVINLKIDFLYKKMSSLALKTERKKVRELHSKWKYVKNRTFTPVTIGLQMSKQILSNPDNVDRINNFISSYNIPQRFENFNPNECRGLGTIKRKICIRTDSPFDTILIAPDELLKLNLQSKLP